MWICGPTGTEPKEAAQLGAVAWASGSPCWPDGRQGVGRGAAQGRARSCSRSLPSPPCAGFLGLAEGVRSGLRRLAGALRQASGEVFHRPSAPGQKETESLTPRLGSVLFRQKAVRPRGLGSRVACKPAHPERMERLLSHDAQPKVLGSVFSRPSLLNQPKRVELLLFQKNSREEDFLASFTFHPTSSNCSQF